MADWHYIGHYGQLGPLTDSQMAELIAGGVIERETYVWCEGMADWIAAYSVTSLSVHFKAAPSTATPPPPPPPGSRAAPISSPQPFSSGLGPIGREVAGGLGGPYAGSSGVPPVGPPLAGPGYYSSQGGLPPNAPLYSSGPYGLVPAQQSDKSKFVAGVLNLIFPGVGRMYLGYPVIGVLQLVLLIIGVGWFWSVVDGLLILTGNVKEDGYGRTLQ